MSGEKNGHGTYICPDEVNMEGKIIKGTRVEGEWTIEEKKKRVKKLSQIN